MRRIARSHSKFLAAVALLFCWQVAAPALAKEPVSCRYLVAAGTRIELELTVTTPPPATLIIMQNLPPEVTVADSAPPVKKFSQKPGEAKWLMMGIKPGTTVLTFTLSKPVRPGQLSGEMLYNAPDTGAMIRMPLTP